jgi:hypothetical protein
MTEMVPIIDQDPRFWNLATDITHIQLTSHLPPSVIITLQTPVRDLGVFHHPMVPLTAPI